MLIGLSGKQGTGKSTLAKEIEMKYPNVKVFKFAGILYEMQDYIYKRVGLTLKGEKDRPLLVALGMWGRDQDPNLWRDVAIKDALEHVKAGGIALIDDVRFPNEADAVARLGTLIRIEGIQRGPNITEEMKNNITETSLDSYPFENRINNNQPLEGMLVDLHKILGG